MLSDILLTLSTIGFSISLIPTLKNQHKLRKVTISGITIVLTITCVILNLIGTALLSLWLAFSTGSLVLVCWVIIGIQKILYRKDQP